MWRNPQNIEKSRIRDMLAVTALFAPWADNSQDVWLQSGYKRKGAEIFCPLGKKQSIEQEKNQL